MKPVAEARAHLSKGHQRRLSTDSHERSGVLSFPHQQFSTAERNFVKKHLLNWRSELGEPAESSSSHTPALKKSFSSRNQQRDSQCALLCESGSSIGNTLDSKKSTTYTHHGQIPVLREAYTDAQAET